MGARQKEEEKKMGKMEKRGTFGGGSRDRDRDRHGYGHGHGRGVVGDIGVRD